jgi:hypothetical protein
MTQWFDKDNVSAFVKKATDILFVMNPTGTSMGTICGFILNDLTSLFDPILKRQEFVDFGKVNIVFWVLLGIFLFNLPSLFRRPRLDPKIEAALASIANAKKEGHISVAQARLMYVSLYQKVLAEVTLDTTTKEQISQIADLSASSSPPSS